MTTTPTQPKVYNVSRLMCGHCLCETKQLHEDPFVNHVGGEATTVDIPSEPFDSLPLVCTGVLRDQTDSHDGTHRVEMTPMMAYCAWSFDLSVWVKWNRDGPTDRRGKENTEYVPSRTRRTESIFSCGLHLNVLRCCISGLVPPSSVTVSNTDSEAVRDECRDLLRQLEQGRREVLRENREGSRSNARHRSTEEEEENTTSWGPPETLALCDYTAAPRQVSGLLCMCALTVFYAYAHKCGGSRVDGLLASASVAGLGNLVESSGGGSRVDGLPFSSSVASLNKVVEF